MVIRGKSRSNGKQLAYYLLQIQDNEAIRVLEVDGQINPEDKALHRALLSMSLSSELSRSNKGLYHAQINPAPGEDKAMSDEQWLEAAGILARQLGFENQRQAIVLHTKKGRTHAHCVWERYDHDLGKMVSESFSRLAQDRARKEMEAVFEQKQTPHRNVHRPELKAHLSELWQQTTTGAEFISKANEQGYLIGAGAGRHPFMVIDENARSHDLPRQLKGVRLKEVRERLRHEKLLTEKQAIEKARAAMDEKETRGGKERSKESNKVRIAYQYAQTGQNITEQPKTITYKAKFEQFIDNQPQQVDDQQPDKEPGKPQKKEKQKQTPQAKQQRFKKSAKQFAENKEKIVKQPTQQEKAREQRRAEFLKELEDIQEQNKKNREHGLEFD